MDGENEKMFTHAICKVGEGLITGMLFKNEAITDCFIDTVNLDKMSAWTG